MYPVFSRLIHLECEKDEESFYVDGGYFWKKLLSRKSFTAPEFFSSRAFRFDERDWEHIDFRDTTRSYENERVFEKSRQVHRKYRLCWFFCRQRSLRHSNWTTSAEWWCRLTVDEDVERGLFLILCTRWWVAWSDSWAQRVREPSEKRPRSSLLSIKAVDNQQDWGAAKAVSPFESLSSSSLYDGEEEKFSPQLKAAFIVFLLKTFTAIKHRFHRSGGPKNSPKNAH